VTIGIPTYLRTNTLIDALKSAISQDYDGIFEILVLDNNPRRNDETEMYMKTMNKVPLVSYYKNHQNLGMAGNWNRIVTLSRSEWVVLLHDDDIIAPCFLKDMLCVAEKYNADVVNSGFLLWKDFEKNRPCFKLRNKQYNIIKSTLSSNHLVHFAGMPSGILYKRDVYIREGGANSDFFPSMDYVFHCNLSRKYNFLIYSKKLTIYRLSINESSNKNTIRTYIPIDYSIRLYIADLLKLPNWYSKYIYKFATRYRLNTLNMKCLNIPELLNIKFKRLNFFEVFLYKSYLRIYKYYYTNINCIGKM
jgi:glycosyltransferase involved in cell wall biosynthesis